MGSPSSGLIAEILLQHVQRSHLTHVTRKHKIVKYCRHVDDILLISDSSHTNIQKILDDFNSLHLKLQFTAEAEKDHTLNYLDISTHRTPTHIRTATFTDTIILFTSNHPTHHKYATVRYLFNRLDTYNLQHEEYQNELNIFHNILHNNSFSIKPLKPLPTTHWNKQQPAQQNKKRLVSLT